MADAIHVQTARCHVGRNQDVQATGLQPLDGQLACGLVHVAVERGAREAARLDPLREFRGRDLGAHEDQHRVEVLHFEDAGQRIELVHAADLPVALRHGRDRCSARLAADLDQLAGVPARDGADRIGHGGREQRDLLFRRRLLQDPLDIVDEAHAQHLVGFIEHHTGQRIEAQRRAAQVIEDAPRGAHDHVHATAQRAQLRAQALPAVHRQHMETRQVAGVGLERLGNLYRELTGRGQNQDLRLYACDVEPAEQRQRKGRRLAGAGLRLTEDVTAFEQRPDCGSLDRRRRLVADLVHGAQHGIG